MKILMTIKTTAVVCAAVLLAGACGALAAPDGDKWTTGKGGKGWPTGVTFKNTTVKYKNLELLNGYNPACEWWGSSGGCLRALDNPKKKQSMRFTSPTSKPAVAAAVYVKYPIGTPPTYRVGLQADMGGNPSGKWLGSGTITPIPSGRGDPKNGTDTWYYATLDKQVNLSKGKVYHVVIQWESGDANGKNGVKLYSMGPPNLWIPFNYDGADSNVNFKDPAVAVRYDSGSGWGPEPNKRNSGLFIVKFQDGTHHGQVYRHRYSGAGGGWLSGEVIKIALQDKTVTRLGCTVAHFGHLTPPRDDLFYEIRGPKMNVLRKGVLVKKESFPAVGWFEVKLSRELLLKKGQTYRIILRCPASKAWNLEASGSTHYKSAAYLGMTYDGVNSYFIRSKDGGKTWIKEPERDLPFRLKLKEIFEGTATSVSRDAGAGKTWRSITFEGKVPVKTSVEIHFKGQDKWIVVKKGALGGKMYAIPPEARGREGQWRLALKTTDAAITPEIEQITIQAGDVQP